MYGAVSQREISALMFRMLDCQSSSSDLSQGQVKCVVFLGKQAKAFNLHSAELSTQGVVLQGIPNRQASPPRGR